jgi:LysM repeat protein
MFGNRLTSNARSTTLRRMRRTYVRRRLIALILAAAVGGLATSGISRAASDDRAPAAAARHTYVVRAGDTLWGIARRVAPGADPRAVVERLIRSNGLTSRPIVPGQRLVVPA